MRRKLIVLGMLVLTLAVWSPVAAQDLYNCDDYDSQEDAQAALDADPSDPNQLDGDDDGMACESHDYGSSGSGDGGTDDTDATDDSDSTDDSDNGDEPGLPVTGGGGMADQGGTISGSLVWIFASVLTVGVLAVAGRQLTGYLKS